MPRLPALGAGLGFYRRLTSKSELPVDFLPWCHVLLSSATTSASYLLFISGVSHCHRPPNPPEVLRCLWPGLLWCFRQFSLLPWGSNDTTLIMEIVYSFLCDDIKALEPQMAKRYLTFQPSRPSISRKGRSTQKSLVFLHPWRFSFISSGTWETLQLFPLSSQFPMRNCRLNLYFPVANTEASLAGKTLFTQQIGQDFLTTKSHKI